jgi:cell division septation protein DedD
MSDLLPPRPDRPLALTRGHLFALGALAVAMSVLTFFIGVQLGHKQGPVAVAPENAPLVPEEVRSGDLEVLLTRVEQAHADPTLSFPRELARSELPSSSDQVPHSGWAIQVAAEPTAEDAQRLVDTLRAAGLSAYRVAALVDGKAEHRVKVGGYVTEDAATAAIPEVKSRAGASEAAVSAAP